jgi:PKD repeat protein
MPDVLFSSNSAVAQLIYHCGVAVNMDYKPQYSGAGIIEARNALVNYFNYASTTQIVQRAAYSEVSWKALIKSELDSARPVFYSGYNQNNTGGHAFVCDGYQANDFFHINWGWGGQYDGYFLLNVLNPNSNNFSYTQSAIVGIKPLNNFPVAHFTTNQTLINSGAAINFTDLSTGNPTIWNWTFTGGNPSSSNLKNPQNIVYSTPGIYPVSLTVGNANANNSLTKNSYIIVAPIAEFKASKTVISTGESINFTDNSTVISQPSSRLWTFTGGNPATSTQKNPSNINYSQAGTYKVSLTINTAEGNHTIIKNNYITVYTNCTYQFKDSIPKYYINPINANGFQINQEDFDSLIPYYSNLGHSTKWNVFNKINSPGDTNFFYGATSFFAQAGQANNWLEIGPLTVPQNGAVLKWEHLYYLNTKRDGYEILLSTSGITRDYYTAPPIFSRTDNDPLTNNDTVWTNQEVNIDGNIYGGQQIYIAFHHFANNKYYLFLDNIKLVSCSGLPVHADFTADSTQINLGGSVDFSDISNGNPISWKWTFYDGNPLTSTLQHPTGIVYNTSGFHTVKLVVNNGEQSDSITKTNFIFTDNTGIFANKIVNDIQIFPNPVNDNLTITIPESSKSYLNIKIYDLLGNEIKDLHFSESKNLVSISMSQFSKGIYIIIIKTNQNSIYKKIIKTE